jgi:hypothetical protein
VDLTKPHTIVYIICNDLHNTFTPPIVYAGTIDQATHCSLLRDADYRISVPVARSARTLRGNVHVLVRWGTYALPNKLCGNHTKDAGFYFRAVLCAVQPPFSLVSGEGLSVNMSAKGWGGLCMFMVMQGIGLLSYLADSHRGIGLWGSMLAVVSLFNITELQLLVKRSGLGLSESS